MIPIFPNFKKIELNDRHAIENITKQFPPYCDFEFIDLWTFNPQEKITISTLYNNLIVKRPDYITDDLFYTFLGINNVKNTILKLLLRSKDENLIPELKHIPKICIESTKNLQDFFNITEDRDNFDYILSIEEIADLKGDKYHHRRNHVNKFKRLYSQYSMKALDLTKETTKHEIKELFFLWEQKKGKSRSETVVELIAIEKLFDLIHLINILGIGVYFQDKLIGFCTYHIIHSNHAIISFEKGDTDYKGIYEYLNHEVAKHLKELGAMYINYEQDLGIAELREAKILWHPVSYLKKYTISEKV